MKNTKFLVLFFLITLAIRLDAAEGRVIPLDMYLIIDASSALEGPKADTVAWINEQVVDRLLMEGDRVTIWAAGDSARIIFSDTISNTSSKEEIKDRIQAMELGMGSPDFSGALREAVSRASQTPQSRLSYTMLITASAEGLEPTLTGSAQGLLRWFRSER